MTEMPRYVLLDGVMWEKKLLASEGYDTSGMSEWAFYAVAEDRLRSLQREIGYLKSEIKQRAEFDPDAEYEFLEARAHNR